MSLLEDKKPEDQFQIGDPVIYVPDGIITRVEGYTFYSDMFNPPKILTYNLSCGISVGADLLSHYVKSARVSPRPVKKSEANK